MKMFIEPLIDRGQSFFLRETLEESIADDHPVRVFDFVLDQHDWGQWRSDYPGGGRPAYPPDVMSKLLVYGYSIGIRSSRALEHACHNSKDFIWLLSGRTPDHDTIADFRRCHAKQFKKIFRTTVAACVEAGMVSLTHLAVDGTRVESNNSDGQTKTSADIETLLAKLDVRIEKIMAEAEAADVGEDTLFGKGVSPNNLPKALKNLQRRQARLKQALWKVKAKADKAMKVESVSAEKAAKKRVPITDPDSDVMKNKGAGFGPNYTPYLGVDAESGVVTTEGVTSSHHDDDHLQPAIEESESNTGLKVEQVQADCDYATPANITYCEDRDIDPCMAPVNTNLQSRKSSREVPPWPANVSATACRVDGSVASGPLLPRTPGGQFDKSAFQYDASSDSYVCPTGHRLTRRGTKLRRRHDGTTNRTVYRCSVCKGCSFVSVCTNDRKGRSISREEGEEIHQRQAERMRDATRRKDYRLRRQSVEPVFGVIKEVLGLRRFLLRGLEYVRGEWSLTTAGLNLKKLARKRGVVGVFAMGGTIEG